jgi:hypothetical protein
VAARGPSAPPQKSRHQGETPLAGTAGCAAWCQGGARGGQKDAPSHQALQKDGNVCAASYLLFPRARSTHQPTPPLVSPMARLRGGKRPQADWRKFLLPSGSVTLLAPIGPPGGEGACFEAMVTLPAIASASATTSIPTPLGLRAPPGLAATAPPSLPLGPFSASSTTTAASPLPAGSSSASALGWDGAAGASRGGRVGDALAFAAAARARSGLGDLVTPLGSVRASRLADFRALCDVVTNPYQRWVLLQLLRETPMGRRTRWGLAPSCR